MKVKAPILIIVYNRVNHFKKCIKHLLQNAETINTDLFISSDGAKSKEDLRAVKKIREITNNLSGFRSVTLLAYEKNVGGHKAATESRDIIFEKYNKLIVLEDDNVPGDMFLSYMNRALLFYENYDEIFSISGFSPNIFETKDSKNRIYFSNSFNAWGFGLWKKKYYDFKKFINHPNLSGIIKKDFNDKVLVKKLNNVSRAYIPNLTYCHQKKITPEFDFSVSYYCTKKNYVNVYFTQTFIKNIGHDGSGERTLFNRSIISRMEKSSFSDIMPKLIEYNGVVENEIMNTYANKFLVNELKLLIIKLRLFDTIKKLKLKFINFANRFNLNY